MQHGAVFQHCRTHRMLRIKLAAVLCPQSTAVNTRQSHCLSHTSDGSDQVARSMMPSPTQQESSCTSESGPKSIFTIRPSVSQQGTCVSVKVQGECALPQSQVHPDQGRPPARLSGSQGWAACLDTGHTWNVYGHHDSVVQHVMTLCMAVYVAKWCTLLRTTSQAGCRQATL